MPCDDCSRAETCPPCVNELEPKGSASSSPDDTCRTCGHARYSHTDEVEDGCVQCPAGKSAAWRHAFVSADAETAGEPECGCGNEACEICTPMRHLPPSPPEPEAPDCVCVCHVCDDSPCDDCTGTDPEAPDPLHDASPCDGCGHFVLDHIDGACKALYCLCGHDVPMPRPPFLVAYATGSGALNELALPGEASVAVVDGSLVISHASGVLGIAHVRPLEGP